MYQNLCAEAVICRSCIIGRLNKPAVSESILTPGLVNR